MLIRVKICCSCFMEKNNVSNEIKAVFTSNVTFLVAITDAF